MVVNKAIRTACMRSQVQVQIQPSEGGGRNEALHLERPEGVCENGITWDNKVTYIREPHSTACSRLGYYYTTRW